jgi:predicted TIM-barrel fold metal-dependent hydrolase
MIIVSADGHAGAQLLEYKAYLAQEWHEEFDAWAAGFDNPFADLEGNMGSRNWDSQLRLAEQESDGVVAEVVFPNTVPPFFPTAAFVAPAPTRLDYERRWAGLQAHNRWLVDFCNDVPGRRAGMAQLMFNDVDNAVAEVTRIKEAGLFGGVLLPGIPPGSEIEPIWHPKYDPIWQVCEDLGVVLNHHGGGGSPGFDLNEPLAKLMFMTEIHFFANRNIWALAWSGVFERHPGLRFAITEQGFDDVLDGMRTHDGFYAMLTGDSQATNAVGARQLMDGYIQNFTRPPSDYIKRNSWFGASFMTCAEVARRDEIGKDRMMWGSDYPHYEGTYPHSVDLIAQAVKGLDRPEVEKLLHGNAIDLYGFDKDVRAAAAARVGPEASAVVSV